MGIRVRKGLSNGLLKVVVWVYKYIFLLEPKLHAYAVTSFNNSLNRFSHRYTLHHGHELTLYPCEKTCTQICLAPTSLRTKSQQHLSHQQVPDQQLLARSACWLLDMEFDDRALPSCGTLAAVGRCLYNSFDSLWTSVL